MQLYSETKYYKLFHGKMQDMGQVINPNSIDSIVCDPPYELNFMGKGWDNQGIAFQKETWKHCYDALKPGGYLLAFGGSRTFHRIACAIEDAGFEIRDCIMWLYGSGFPKSMNIGLAIDKKNGVESKVVGKGKSGSADTHTRCMNSVTQSGKDVFGGEYEIKEAQNEWNGWGSCLKPAFEPIIVARKPFKGSLVDNVLEYGVGSLNIDECRVALEEGYEFKTTNRKARQDDNVFDNYNCGFDSENNTNASADPKGRFPANVILTYDESDYEEVCGGFPNTKGGSRHNFVTRLEDSSSYGGKAGNINTRNEFNDEGSAARYFMNCKYSRKDEEIWKQLLVNNAGNNLEILKATRENIVQMNVEELLKELKNHYAKYAENQQTLIETSIVQDIAKILTWDLKIETSQVIQVFIGNYNKCSQFLNLVQFVEKMDNIDTTQITQNLLKLFGYVKVVITNYIQGNIEFDQKRYIYTPKASKKDRDEGLDTFETKTKVFNGKSDKPSQDMKDVEQRFTTNAKNIHPTVKPTQLMQYLVRLVTPKGGTVLDCFMGSGSTGKAVMFENRERNANYKFIGIEMTDEYLPICEARIDYALNKYEYDIEKEKEKETGQLDIFSFLEKGDNLCIK